VRVIWCQERRRKGVATWRRCEVGDEDDEEEERKDEDSGEGLGGMSFRGLCEPEEFFSTAVMEEWDGVERDSSSAAADSE
jgi:hypothetical protein